MHSDPTDCRPRPPGSSLVRGVGAVSAPEWFHRARGAIKRGVDAAWELARTELRWLAVALGLSFVYVNASGLPVGVLQAGVWSVLVVAVLGGLASWAGFFPAFVAEVEERDVAEVEVRPVVAEQRSREELLVLARQALGLSSVPGEDR